MSALQGCTLSAEDQKYGDTWREIDRLEGVIGGKPMALFSAREFMWFSAHVSKMYFSPKQDQLDRQLGNLKTLLATLNSRKL